MKLQLDPPPAFSPDDVYARLVALGAGKSDRDARQAMAALALVLINHIADEAVIGEALDLVERLPSAERSSGEQGGGA